MNILIIIHDAPYGNEKAYNAFRFAMTIQNEHKDTAVDLYLMTDAVSCAVKNQKTPNGYYNIERMVQSVIRNGGKIKMCGTCMDARGVNQQNTIEGAERSSMGEFTNLVLNSEKVVSF